MTAAVAAAGLAAVALQAPVGASGAQVTRGDFVTTAAGHDAGYDIGGRAQMVRTADGKTIVTVNLTGLLPADHAYAVHVHNAPCSTGGGGHYQFPAGTPAIDGASPVVTADGVRYEIWPGPVDPNPAGNGSGQVTVAATAGAEASSVVVHVTSTGGNRLACADLG